VQRNFTGKSCIEGSIEKYRPESHSHTSLEPLNPDKNSSWSVVETLASKLTNTPEILFIG
jgi:hypothetical protein